MHLHPQIQIPNAFPVTFEFIAVDDRVVWKPQILFFLNINAPLVSIHSAHTDCAHTLIFRLELNIVEFEPRILHNTVPIAVCTVLRHKGIKNIASIGCCIIKLIRVLITMPLYMFRKLVNSRLSKDFIVRS